MINYQIDKQEIDLFNQEIQRFNDITQSRVKAVRV
jgi:hypothetical protein